MYKERDIIFIMILMKSLITCKFIFWIDREITINFIQFVLYIFIMYMALKENFKFVITYVRLLYRYVTAC